MSLILTSFGCKKIDKHDFVNKTETTIKKNMNFNNSNMINNTNPYLYLNNSQFEENRDNSIYDLDVYKDKLFIPDFRHNRLIVFGLPDGNILSTFNVPMPHGIAIDIDGGIYICTYSENSIFVIKNSNKRVIENSQFDYPLSIAIKDNYTIIANYGDGSSGNLIYSDDGLITFHQFTNEWMDSKPHAVRFNKKGEIVVVYRNLPGLVIYNQNGQIITQKFFSDNFDPLSIIEYNSNYLVPNYVDGNIYLFDSSFNILNYYYGGGHIPTNLSMWNNLLFISEQEANQILSFNLNIIDNSMELN